MTAMMQMIVVSLLAVQARRVSVVLSVMIGYRAVFSAGVEVPELA